MESVARLSILRVQQDRYFFDLELPTKSLTSPALNLQTPSGLAGWVILDLELRSRLKETIDVTVEGLHLLYPDVGQRLRSQAPAAVGRLEQLGKFMFNFLLPPVFQDILRQLPDGLPLMLATNDTELPWELLHDSQQYLALKYAVGRQLLSPTLAHQNPRPSQSERSFLFIDNPEGDLPESNREIQNLIDDCDATPDNIVARRLSHVRASKSAVLQALTSNLYQVIHYSGHATPGALTLADGELTAEEIGRALNGQPFIFLNACRSAKEGVAPVDSTHILPYAGLSAHSLASAFILGGAIGFIGTLWEVFDASSREFAEWFYALALDGIPVGEALRQTRQRLRHTHPDDPLWASFVLYGDPTLQIAGVERRETRPVTVLVARFSGLLHLFDTLDLETAAKIKKQALDLLFEVAQHYKGEADGPLTNILSVCFGAPATYGDDAERAIRTALEMVHRWQDFNRRQARHLPAPLVLQLGISTGRVVGQQFSGAVYQITGQVVDLAAELATRTGENQIWVDEATRRLTQTVFAFEPLEALFLRERAQPITAYRVLGPKEASLLPAEMIGREGEINQLQGWWRETVAGQGRLISIVGQAGVGKTRLVQAFKERLTDQEQRWIVSTCQSYQQTISYGLLAQIIRGLAEVVADDNEAVSRSKLAHLIRPVMRSTDAQAEERLSEGLALLGQVTGLPHPDPAIDTLEPELRQRKLVGLVQAVLAHQAARQPLSIVLEDLHWIDEASLAVLDQVLGAVDRMRVICLAIYRPDWSNVWSRWGHYRHLVLGELNSETQRALLARLLGLGTLPKMLIEAILSRTGGNPFFIEEMVRSLQESGVLTRSGQTWEPLADLAGVSLPDKVEHVMLARLDRLAAASREVLQRAAVIGQEFEYNVLVEIQDGATREQLERHLDDLISRDLIYTTRGWYPPDITYAFRHALIQQTVYTHLLEKSRRTVHRLTAQALTRLYPPDGEGVVERAAHHYHHSDDRVQAIIYCLRAAKRAAQVWANQTVLDWYNRTLLKLQSFMETPPVESEQEQGVTSVQILHWHVETLEGQAGAQVAIGSNDKAIGSYQQALALAMTSTAFPTTRQADLYGKMAIAHQDKGEFEAAQEALNKGLAVLKGLPCLEAGRLYVWTGLIHFRRGQLAEALAACEQGIAFIESVQDMRDLAQAYNLRGLIYHEMGRSQEAISDHEQSIALYEAAEYIPGLERAYSNLGCVYHDLSQWDEALHYFQESVALSDRTGEAWRRAAAAINLGEIYRPQGELDQAIKYYEQARQIGDEFGFTELIGLALMNLGASYLKKGLLAEARGYLEESLSLYRRSGAEVHLPEVLRYLAELHGQRSQPDEAVRLAQKALDWAAKLEHPLEVGLAQRALGQAKQGVGQLAEAESHLEQSLAILETRHNPYEVGLTLLELARLRQAQAHMGEGGKGLREQGIAYCDQATNIFNKLGAELDLKLVEKVRWSLVTEGGG